MNINPKFPTNLGNINITFPTKHLFLIKIIMQLESHFIFCLFPLTDPLNMALELAGWTRVTRNTSNLGLNIWIFNVLVINQTSSESCFDKRVSL